MRFAPVLPVGMYETVDKGTYHMVQAHLLAEDAHIARWIGQWGRANAQHWLMLDNGAAEMGDPNIDALFKVAAYIDPDEIICPDVVGNADQTVKLAIENIDKCAKLASKIMLVPHGRTMEELIECTQRLWYVASEHHLGRRLTLGISKFILPEAPWARSAFVAWLYDNFRPHDRQFKIDVHLLGTTLGLEELTLLTSRFIELRGCDTTFPYACAYHGETVTLNHFGTKHLVYEREFHPPPERLPELTAHTAVNVAVFRKELEVAYTQAPRGLV